MTISIDKAIEIKQLALDTGIVNDPEDFKVADQLSLEALKRIQAYRSSPLMSEHRRILLPGETKD